MPSSDRPGFQIAGATTPIKANMKEFDVLRKLADMLQVEVELITEKLRPVLSRFQPDQEVAPMERNNPAHMLDEQIFEVEDKLISVRRQLEMLRERITF